MTSLSDRYVHAVLRELPSGQRRDLEPEIRALVGDAIDARTNGGGHVTDAEERAVLAELGDPAVLAARYADRTQYVIGPALFPEWRRLLTLLLPIVVPIVSLVILGTSLLAEQTVGQAVTAAVGTAINVALQTVFWVTLVFFVIERVGATSSVSTAGTTWSVNDLPELPEDGRIGILDTIALIAANVAIGIALLWMQLQPPIVIDGVAFALFDPALWSFWLPWFLVITGLEILFGIALFMRGRWTWGFAAVNALLGAAFAIPAVYLIGADLLFNPALIAKVEGATAASTGTWLDVTGITFACVIVSIVAWDAIDGFRKAHAASRPMLARPQH